MSMFLSLLLGLTEPTSIEPIILACAPPPDMCAVLEKDCNGAGVDPNRCLELAEGVCPGDRCLACDRAAAECEAAGGDCEAVIENCEAALEGCSCDPGRCRDVTELTLPQLFSTCFAWPMAIGQCEEPSVGQCLTTLPWIGCAGLTTCEYTECMEDIALFGTCGDFLPASCDRVVACVDAEATGDIPSNPLTTAGRIR
jgi:hypothetical protein